GQVVGVGRRPAQAEGVAVQGDVVLVDQPVHIRRTAGRPHGACPSPGVIRGGGRLFPRRRAPTLRTYPSPPGAVKQRAGPNRCLRRRRRASSPRPPRARRRPVKRRIPFLLALLALPAPPPAGAGEDPRVARLITQLGSDAFAEREEAGKARG